MKKETEITKMVNVTHQRQFNLNLNNQNVVQQSLKSKFIEAKNVDDFDVQSENLDILSSRSVSKPRAHFSNQIVNLKDQII